MLKSNIICLFGQNCGKTKQVWSKTCLKEIVCVYSKSEEESRHRETIQSNFIWGHCDTVDVVKMEEEHSLSDSTPGEEQKCGITMIEDWVSWLGESVFVVSRDRS